MRPSNETRDAAHWEAVEEASELLHEERFQDALYALRDVAKADPTNPYAFHFMGVALFELGEVEPARDAYRAALRLAPDYLGSRVALSHVLRMLGDLRGAAREAREALERHPGDGDAMHAAGLALAGEGRDDEAERHLEAFLATNPEFEIATEVRGVLAMLRRKGSGPLEIDERDDDAS